MSISFSGVLMSSRGGVRMSARGGVRMSARGGVRMSARGGVAGGVMSSVVGMYCTANLFAGCADGGADIALGRGGAIACLRRGCVVRGSARGVE